MGRKENVGSGGEKLLALCSPVALSSLQPKPPRVVGDQGGLAPRSSLDVNPVLPGGSRLPTAPALALPM